MGNDSTCERVTVYINRSALLYILFKMLFNAIPSVQLKNKQTNKQTKQNQKP